MTISLFDEERLSQDEIDADDVILIRERLADWHTRGIAAHPLTQSLVEDIELLLAIVGRLDARVHLPDWDATRYSALRAPLATAHAGHGDTPPPAAEPS